MCHEAILESGDELEVHQSDIFSLWPGLGGLLVHRLWWLWFPLVAEVAGGDADCGVMLAMVCLMPLAWVM